MASPSVLQKKNGQCLWFALLGLGFQPDTAASPLTSKANIAMKRVNLGPSMFDKPNKDAFYLVSHFLLKKLNPTRFQEAYRHCWPILSHKDDAEFRKVTCMWLKEIMNETANAGSKVVTSLLISPGGPKFISLMLDLANYVMLQEMKALSADKSWVPEAAAVPASTLDMAVKRFNLVRSRFVRGAVDQDHLLQEYQRRAQLLVKSVNELKAERAKYDNLLKQQSCDSTDGEEETAEKIKKVRALWSTIQGMLSSIKEGQKSVDCVLKGDVDQYVLDGTDGVLKIPHCLLERIEQPQHQLRSGNLYETGQLNLLSVMELMNHALQILKERHHQAPDTSVSAQLLQDKCQQMSRMLQDLHLIRQRISKEEIPQRKSAIKEMEAEWDTKWKNTLKDTALVSFLNEDPALGFLSPMAPLSFEPAGEDCYRSCVFSKYPAKLLDKHFANGTTQGDPVPNDSILRSSQPTAAETPESPAVSTEVPPSNTSLDWLFHTPPSPPLKTLSATAPLASSKKMDRSIKKEPPTMTQTLILDKEYENLADQFAEAVITTSPSGSQEKGLDLEDLLRTLQKDPFSTRKQLPRTPESLILDVKTSWRKAIQEDKAKKNLSSVLSDSVTGHFSPSRSSGACSSPPISQQSFHPKSFLLWDTENLDSPSGTGSSAVQFSLDQETLPELPSCDSLLSLSDEDDLLVPHTKMKPAPSSTCKTRQACSGSLVLENIRNPECLQTSSDWLSELKAPEEPADRLFSLDLDQLEKTSPLKKQDYSLPALITFSPMDDMKC